MKIFYFEFVGLICFFISGLVFIMAGIINEDLLSTFGSIVWTVACLLWFIPVFSRKNNNN